MQEETKVLDHGYVRYQGHLGGEEDIIRAARMSTDKGFLGWGGWYQCTKCGIQEAELIKPEHCQPTEHNMQRVEKDEKLLEYLYKNHHMTPFEMLELRVEVKAPIFVFREWMRHRTQDQLEDSYDDLGMMSFNEMSARYIQMPNEHYVPVPRMQSKLNKQASEQLEGVDLKNLKMFFGSDNETNALTWMEMWDHEQREIYDTYETAVEEGVAKEVARINTPVSRYSKMWAKANLRNWLHFLNLRLRPNAQLEIRLYAEAVSNIIKELWPRTYDLFENYTLNSVSFSAREWEEHCRKCDVQ